MDTAVEVNGEHVPDRIKIWFRFVPREGWLSYDKEGLWADDGPETLQHRAPEAHFFL